MSESTIDQDELVMKIGQLVQMLRVSMQELGLSKEIEKAAEVIPDTQDQLDYIHKMTEQAAHRALTAIDKINPIFESINKEGNHLKQIISETIDHGSEHQLRETLVLAQHFISANVDRAQEGKREVLEIIMAQDFQDLTGQVIKKLTALLKEIQHQLLQVIMESGGEGGEEAALKRLAKNEWDDEDEKNALLNGPQIKPTAGDAVSSQDQVDDLLQDLGL